MEHGDLRVTHIGHSTVLIQVSGLNLLTDPVFSPRVGPFRWLGMKRYCRPGIPFESLPPIDLVLLSHDHYDHLDIPSLRRLAEAHQPRFIAGLGVSKLLAAAGIVGGEDIDWWERRPGNPEVEITAVPVQHWSGRHPFARGKTLWCGYVIDAPGGPVYFAGDTGWGPHFLQTAERFGAMRFAILPIGAFQPRWFMKGAHLSPEEAVRAARVLQAQASMAVHFGTFPLAADGQHEPQRVLEAYLQRQPEPRPDFFVLEPGQGRSVSSLPAGGGRQREIEVMG